MMKSESVRRSRQTPRTPAQPVEQVRLPREQLSPALLALGYAIFAIAGVLCAIYEVLLVPTRWGDTLIPLAPALAIISNVALPIICRTLTDTVLSALPPVLGWLVATFVLGSSRPEGDVLLPAGPTGWVSISLIVCGMIAAAITISLGDLPRDWIMRRVSRLRAPTGSDSDGAR